MAVSASQDGLEFLGDGGKVGAKLRALDWAASPLGRPAGWPNALRTTAALCLASPFPLVLWWGTEFALLYNDSWIAVAGEAPVCGLGRAAEPGWPALWQALAPAVRRAAASGETSGCDNPPGPFARFSFANMAVRNGDGSVGGVLSAVRETVTREQLRHESELLQTIIDTIPVMITLFEPNTKLLRVNREFERVIGWGAADIATISLMDECYPDPAYREEVRCFMESFAPEWKDIRMRTRDHRFIETSWANIRISDHTQVGIGIDITDRKRAEQQRTLLINELNHRVKNTLATVQSLAVQSLRDAGMGDARDRLEARLFALAQAHDLLTVEGWFGANLGDVVERAVAPFRAAEERITLAGPLIRLQPKQALAFSMALHELATNALKYGALSIDGGRVTIAWRRLDDPDSRFELVWQEEGGPPVPPPEHKGFGSRLLERNLARELDGTAAIEFHPTGVVCRITCAGGDPRSLLAKEPHG